MMMINQGKMFIRRLRSESAIIGIIAVPSNIEAELIYPIILSDELGIMFVNTPRQVRPEFTCPVDEYDMAGLMSLDVYKRYPAENVFDAFIRDTDLPDAPEGHKWVLAGGPSLGHKGVSRLITVDNDKVSTVEGDICIGHTINGAVGLPIWGNQDKPSALATTAVYASIPKIRAQTKQDPDFLKFVEKMEAILPAKSHYTAEELKVRDDLGRKVMSEILADKSADKPKFKF